MFDHTIESGNPCGKFPCNNLTSIYRKNKFFYIVVLFLLCPNQKNKTFSQESTAVLYILRSFELKTLWTIKPLFSFSEIMLQPQILYKKMDFRTSDAAASLSPSGGWMQTALNPYLLFWNHKAFKTEKKIFYILLTTFLTNSQNRGGNDAACWCHVLFTFINKNTINAHFCRGFL